MGCSIFHDSSKTLGRTPLPPTPSPMSNPLMRDKQRLKRKSRSKSIAESLKRQRKQEEADLVEQSHLIADCAVIVLQRRALGLIDDAVDDDFRHVRRDRLALDEVELDEHVLAFRELVDHVVVDQDLQALFVNVRRSQDPRGLDAALGRDAVDKVFDCSSHKIDGTVVSVRRDILGRLLKDVETCNWQIGLVDEDGDQVTKQQQ